MDGHYLAYHRALEVWYCFMRDWEDDGGQYIAAKSRGHAKHLAASALQCEYIEVAARKVRGEEVCIEGPRCLSGHEVFDLTGMGACGACGEWEPLTEYGGVCDECRITAAPARLPGGPSR